MKKIISLTLILLLCPALGFTQPPPPPGGGPIGHPPGPFPGGPIGHPPGPFPGGPIGPPHPPLPFPGGPGGFYRHHHNDWVAPLAFFGTALGIIALTQPYYPPPPPPSPRMCRDTYNYVDKDGRYLYSEYVDRPCRD